MNFFGPFAPAEVAADVAIPLMLLSLDAESLVAGSPVRVTIAREGLRAFPC